MKKKRKTILLGIPVLLALIQFVPVQRDNPPVISDLTAPKAVKSILVASCYDCHSHLTRWPAYSYVAPVSWLVAYDVREGRAHMNFSRWGEYSDGAKEFRREQIFKKVSAGEMPLATYLLLHPAARVTPSSLAVLKEWASPTLDTDTDREQPPAPVPDP
ncbi:MAG: heme-binding domain-containing protein [Lentisphaerae bacterium]|nr:heme-binding domain-containing protein [Lentisphaerota bacterium]